MQAGGIPKLMPLAHTEREISKGKIHQSEMGRIEACKWNERRERERETVSGCPGEKWKFVNAHNWRQIEFHYCTMTMLKHAGAVFSVTSFSLSLSLSEI